MHLHVVSKFRNLIGYYSFWAAVNKTSLKCCLNEIEIASEVLLYKDTSGFDSFLANVHILNSLITPARLWFSRVFRKYKMGALIRIGWRLTFTFLLENKYFLRSLWRNECLEKDKKISWRFKNFFKVNINTSLTSF